MQTAAFTVAQDETHYIRKWVRSHKPHFSRLYILDHDTAGDAADELHDLGRLDDDIHILPVKHDESYDSTWLAQVTRKFQAYLLESYEVVMFSAADEIVVNTNGTLKEYLYDFYDGEPHAVYAAGVEVVHKQAEEPSLDWESPWLAQRSFWYPCRKYTKPVIAKTPVFWRPGWHSASNVPQTDPYVDESLLLVHTHKIDYDYCRSRHRAKTARRWSPEDRNEGPFRHNRVEDPEQLNRWLLSDADNTREYAKLRPIPDQLKGLL